jgi:hypothetical protein
MPLEKPGRYYVRADLVFRAEPAFVLMTEELAIEVVKPSTLEDEAALRDYRSLLRSENPYPELDVRSGDPLYFPKIVAQFMGLYPQSVYTHYVVTRFANLETSPVCVAYLESAVFDKSGSAHLRPGAATTLLRHYRQKMDMEKQRTLREWFMKEMPEERRYTSYFTTGNRYFD